MSNKFISFGLAFKLMNDNQSNYLDNFVPFVATLITKKNIKKIEINRLETFQKYFFSEYGLMIPHHPMLLILDKCRAKYNLMSNSKGVLYPKMNECEKYNITKEVFKLENDGEKFKQNFKEFAQREYDEEIQVADINAVIIEFLKEHDADILFYDHNVSFLSDESSNNNIIIMSLLYRYLICCYENDNSDFNYILNIAIGHLITNTLLVSDVQWENEEIHNLNIYLDTPLVLRAFGIGEESYKKIYEDFFKNILDYGWQIFVFEHTKDEIVELLESSLTWLDDAKKVSYDPEKASITTKYFMQEGYKSYQVELMIEKIEEKLNEMGIEIVSKPSYLLNEEFEIDESQLMSIIETKFKEQDSRFNDDLFKMRTQRDVDSISAIYRLRSYNRPKRIKDMKYCFVTSNATLAYANRLYNKTCDVNEKEILACLTDTFIGTVIWLNKPKQIEKDMKMKLITDSYSAIRPNNKTESKIRIIAKELMNEDSITEEDYLLLSTSHITKDFLSEKSLGDSNRINSTTALEILEEIKFEASKEYREKYQILGTEFDEYKKESALKEKEKEKEVINAKYNYDNERNKKNKIANELNLTKVTLKGIISEDALKMTKKTEAWIVVLFILMGILIIKIFDSVISGVICYVLGIFFSITWSKKMHKKIYDFFENKYQNKYKEMNFDD